MGTTCWFSVVYCYPLIPNNTHAALGIWLYDQLAETTGIQTEWTVNFPSFLPIRRITKKHALKKNNKKIFHLLCKPSSS